MRKPDFEAWFYSLDLSDLMKMFTWGESQDANEFIDSCDDAFAEMTEEERENLYDTWEGRAIDVWADAEDSFLMRERLPKGWTKRTSPDYGTIYDDGDGNEYTKDGYGHLVRIEDTEWC